MSGWLPAATAMPGHAGVRQAIPEVCGTTDRGLRRADDAAARRGRLTGRPQRAGPRRGESAAWRAAIARRRAADLRETAS